MPNNTTVRMLVTGPDDQVSALKELITNREDQVEYDNGEKGPNLMDFDRVIPQPEDVRKTLKDLAVTPLWYTWRNEHWGTKWNSYWQTPDIDEPGRYAIYFVTAWGPPDPVFMTLAEKFPECAIHVWWWVEGNYGAEERYQWSDGHVTAVRKDHDEDWFETMVVDRTIEETK